MKPEHKSHLGDCNRAWIPGFAVNWVVFTSSRRTYPMFWWSLCDQFGHAPQILHSSCKREFVSRASEATQSQAIEPEDGLEMGKEHLDLLALAA